MTCCPAYVPAWRMIPVTFPPGLTRATPTPAVVIVPLLPVAAAEADCTGTVARGTPPRVTAPALMVIGSAAGLSTVVPASIAIRTQCRAPFRLICPWTFVACHPVHDQPWTSTSCVSELTSMSDGPDQIGRAS